MGLFDFLKKKKEPPQHVETKEERIDREYREFQDWKMDYNTAAEIIMNGSDDLKTLSKAVNTIRNYHTGDVNIARKYLERARYVKSCRNEDNSHYISGLNDTFAEIIVAKADNDITYLADYYSSRLYEDETRRDHIESFNYLNPLAVKGNGDCALILCDHYLSLLSPKKTDEQNKEYAKLARKYYALYDGGTLTTRHAKNAIKRIENYLNPAPGFIAEYLKSGGKSELYYTDKINFDKYLILHDDDDLFKREIDSWDKNTHLYGDPELIYNYKLRLGKMGIPEYEVYASEYYIHKAGLTGKTVTSEYDVYSCFGHIVSEARKGNEIAEKLVEKYRDYIGFFMVRDIYMPTWLVAGDRYWSPFYSFSLPDCHTGRGTTEGTEDNLYYFVSTPTMAMKYASIAVYWAMQHAFAKDDSKEYGRKNGISINIVDTDGKVDYGVVSAIGIPEFEKYIRTELLDYGSYYLDEEYEYYPPYKNNVMAQAEQVAWLIKGAEEATISMLESKNHYSIFISYGSLVTDEKLKGVNLMQKLNVEKQCVMRFENPEFIPGEEYFEFNF